MREYAKNILELINASDGHMTAEQIFLKLKQQKSGVVLATVYNNLNYLYGRDLIRKISIEGYADRYDKILKHDHLICKRCGKIIDFGFEDLTKDLQRQSQEKFIGYDLKVFIVCAACAARQNEEQTALSGIK